MITLLVVLQFIRKTAMAASLFVGKRAIRFAEEYYNSATSVPPAFGCVQMAAWTATQCASLSGGRGQTEAKAKSDHECSHFTFDVSPARVRNSWPVLSEELRSRLPEFLLFLDEFIASRRANGHVDSRVVHVVVHCLDMDMILAPLIARYASRAAYRAVITCLETATCHVAACGGSDALHMALFFAQATAVSDVILINVSDL